jgi:hypothetical protein
MGKPAISQLNNTGKNFKSSFALRIEIKDMVLTTKR